MHNVATTSNWLNQIKENDVDCKRHYCILPEKNIQLKKT